MLIFTVRRLISSILVLIVTSFIVFMFTAATYDPLKPFRARNPQPPPAFFKAKEHQYHLDQPVLERYWNWLTNLVHFSGSFPWIKFNFGYDVNGAPVSTQLAQRLEITSRMIVAAIIVALILAIVGGVISGVRRGKPIDAGVTFLTFVLLALPTFWFALVLKQIGIGINESVGDQVFYTIGSSSVVASGGFWTQFGDVLGHLILPTISLALTSYAAWSRYQRASMLEVLNSDYVRLARAKGLPRWTVTRKHALRNALIPLTTVTALDIGSILGGAVVTETVFQWQGAGAFLLEAIKRSDVYAVEAWLLIAATFIILLNLIADLLYGLLDPRIRYA